MKAKKKFISKVWYLSYQYILVAVESIQKNDKCLELDPIKKYPTSQSKETVPWYCPSISCELL